MSIDTIHPSRPAAPSTHFVKASMFEFFRSLFFKRSAKSIAQTELEDAQRLLLQFQAHREYYEQMVVFASKRIDRLTKYLSE